MRFHKFEMILKFCFLLGSKGLHGFFERFYQVAMGLKWYSNTRFYGVAWGSMKLHEVEMGLKL